MSVRKDTVQVSMMIDGKQAMNQLGKLEMEARELKGEIKGMKKGTDDYVTANKKLNQVSADIVKMRKELGVTGMTMQQLTRYQRDLRQQITNTTTKGTAEYKRLNQELSKVNAQVGRQRMEMNGMSSIFSKLGKEIRQFGMIAIGYLGVMEVTNQLRNLTRKAGEYSDQLAAVRKTTGLTAEQVEYLNQQFKTFDTRTARKELLSMAKVAGKLGITELRDVEGFVRSFDKINVALGEDLGDPEDVSRKLGKIMNSFNVNETYGIEEGLLKVGSAINHLGKMSVANEGYIVEFTRRMAGIAPLAQLSLQDVMGMAATLDALGQTSEVSSTALNKLFIKMTQNKEQFAEYAKTADGASMSAQEFAKLIDTDFNEAFISLLRGVKGNANGMNELAVTLGDLEMDGGRVIGVLGTMANNIDMLYDQQKISNDEFERGTSVLEEFALMNETLGAKMDKIGKELYSMFVNSSLVAGIERIVDTMYSWIQVPLSEEIANEQVELNMLVSSLINANDNQKVRNELISELNQKYPGFLQNMDAEKMTAESLRNRLSEVNEQYRNKIIMQAAEEEFTDMLKIQVDLMKSRIDAEKQLATVKKELADNPNMGDGSTRGVAVDKAIAYRIAELDKNIASIDEQILKKQAEVQELMARFGSILLPSSGSGTMTTQEDAATPTTPLAAPTEEASTMKDIMLAEITAWYNAQLLLLKQSREQQLITEEEYNRREQELKIAHLIGQRELAVINGADTVKLDQEIADLKYAILKKSVDDSKEEYERNRDNQIALAEEGEQNFQNMARSIGDSFRAMSDIINTESEAGIKAQLAFAQASVLASRGVALASAIEGASKASTATGPLAPFTLAAYIASMVGTVIAAFGDASRNVKQANSAKNNLNKGKSRTNSFYYGGETGYGNKSLGGDQYGSYSGMFATHAGEFVEPAYIRHYPDVIDAENVMKMRMSGRSQSQQMNVSTTIDSSSMKPIADKMNQAASMIVDIFGVLMETGIPAVLSDDIIRRSNDRLNKYNQNRSRGQN